jgi:proline dehydrogenase
VNEDDCIPVVDKMFAKGVFSVLDYSVEGKEEEEQFDVVLEKTLKLIDFAKEKKEIPFTVFKPSGFGRIDLYQIIGEEKKMNDTETNEWNRVVARFDKVCKASYDNDIALLIDSEESWMQNAVDDLVADMMRKYNKSKPIIFNTLQMYRWDRMDYLKKLHEQAKSQGFYIGIKLVRGAYMEKENERAKEMGYPSPIYSSKEATDGNYNNAIRYMVENIDFMSVFAGTHNESSTYFLMNLMQEKGIEANDSRVWFGQLYGMSDNISFNLAANGYNVAKYLPFGPVKDVMPYLIRRAEENTSVAGQTNRELTMIKAERNRRKEI